MSDIILHHYPQSPVSYNLAAEPGTHQVYDWPSDIAEPVWPVREERPWLF